ncbi:MAG: hypothetical protein FJX65_05170 [Alphaproteobacteria bacterium]|nr:hypothetical protein [Alphaproteobacteria bacterium]
MISRWAVAGVVDTATALNLIADVGKLTPTPPTWLVGERALSAWEQLPDFHQKVRVGVLDQADVYANPAPFATYLRHHAKSGHAPIATTLGTVFDLQLGTDCDGLLRNGVCVLCLPAPVGKVEREVGSALLRQLPGTVRIYDVLESVH